MLAMATRRKPVRVITPWPTVEPTAAITGMITEPTPNSTGV
jgi:hypothetical protein